MNTDFSDSKSHLRGTLSGTQQGLRKGLLLYYNVVTMTAGFRRVFSL